MRKAQCLLVVLLSVGLAHSWDFVLSVDDRLEFYTHDGIKSGTVLLDSQKPTALAYKEVHNIVLYVDKWSNNDAICGYKITSKKHECYIESNGRNIQSLAFDRITELLFFTDINEKSINWFSFNPGSRNNVFGNLLIKMDDGTPTDIVVDSCRGYIYWSNIKHTPTIERARFNGSEREVIFKTNELDLQSLTICQQTQKIYWVMPQFDTKAHLYRADLNGKNAEPLDEFKYSPQFFYPNTLTNSKEFLFFVDRCLSCSKKRVWKLKKPIQRNLRNYEFLFDISTESPVGIAANYKVKDNIQGIMGCNEVPNNYEIKVYEGPFRDHDVKVNEQSVCKCTPGYTGERCDVTVCENYCFQGTCSFNSGLPKCRCNAGYSGDRCEVNECHRYCLNNGSCSLNEKSEPVCQCKGVYLGDRCESSVCENYCFRGICSLSEERLPICRCDAGYSGNRCEVNMCSEHCLNNGTCSLNEEDEPVCECIEEFEGERCDRPVSLNNGDGSLNKDVEPVCQCVGSNDGSNRKADQNMTTSIFRLEESESNLTLKDLLVNWRKYGNQ